MGKKVEIFQKCAVRQNRDRQRGEGKTKVEERIGVKLCKHEEGWCLEECPALAEIKDVGTYTCSERQER